MLRIALLSATIVLANLSPAQAQEAVSEDMRDKVIKGDEKREDGWKFKVKLGLTGALQSSTDVVGQNDGETVQIGGLLNAGAHWVGGPHEWETLLDLQEGMTRTPATGGFNKSSDLLTLQSTYFYRFESIDWLGVFAKLRFDTSIFGGDIRVDQTTRVSGVDATGAPVEVGNAVVAEGSDVSLTDPFEPMVFRETAGVFANPLEKKEITIKTKLGVGAQEIVARGGFAPGAFSALGAPDAQGATQTLVLTEIESSADIGAELTVALEGVVLENWIGWHASADIFLPVYTTAETGSAIDRLSTDLKAGLSLKLMEYLSLDYLFNARRIPAVIDEWQLQHSLLLTAGFQIL